MLTSRNLSLYNLFLGRGRNLIKFLFDLYLKRKQLCDNNVQLVFAKQIYPKCNSSSTSLSKRKRGELTLDNHAALSKFVFIPFFFLGERVDIAQPFSSPILLKKRLTTLKCFLKYFL